MCINKVTDELNKEVQKLLSIGEYLKYTRDCIALSLDTKSRIYSIIKENEGLTIKSNLANIASKIYDEIIETNTAIEE